MKVSYGHFEKGHPRLPGAGRKKGQPNNATRNAREAISRFIDGNLYRLQGWLDEIEQEQGALAAFRCVVELLEYHVPKLAKAEISVDKSPDVEKNTFDSSILTYEERQIFRALIERAAAGPEIATKPGGVKKLIVDEAPRYGL